MKMIRPVAVTDATLVAASVPETDYAAWDGGTTYAQDAKVIRPNHRIYQSLVAANAGQMPETSPTKWQDVGPTNRWAMLDDRVGTLTSATGTISLSVKPGSIDALALIDLNAASVTVEMKEGAAVRYSRTRSTNIGGVAISDWYLYFFEPLGRRRALSFLDLPTYPDATVTITINGETGSEPVSAGTLIVGRQLDLGSTGSGASAGILDFSRKATDDFGVVSVVERAFAKRMTVKTKVRDAATADFIQEELAKVRAMPVLWIGSETRSALTVYGFYKSFSLDLELADIAYCSLEIEGLT